MCWETCLFPLKFLPVILIRLLHLWHKLTCSLDITYKDCPFVATRDNVGGVMSAHIGGIEHLEGDPQHLAEPQHLLVLFTYSQGNKTCIFLF